MRRHCLLLLLYILCGCSSSSTTRNIHSGRITSQQGYPVILYPQEKECPSPQYPWPSLKKPIITTYSFYCRGTSQFLETETDILYDCDGFTHSLCKNFPFHPRLIDITRVLNKQYSLSIREGFCCQKHLNFLQALGIALPKKHLQGNAVRIWISETPSVEELNRALLSLYKKTSTYPMTIEFSTTNTTLSNGEFFITLTPENLGTLLSIELLYDIETSQKICSSLSHVN
ncbi:hypothetical protein [Chlamydia gallinacea]|uniref:hypothetical protein n=1 Tax=Chlamydia gallinacea TaxID=1457153 RepID=UPI0009C381F6|nr:hypothetical protein [Chlamydia gallinacea]AQT77930.1 hypothetical protein B1F83_02880 [Chlamydia gallinacea]